MLTKKRIICVLVGILLVLIVWTAWGNTALELNTYTISSRELPDAFDGYRVAQVSRGLGNRIIPFRFNNRPEVVLIELKSQN